MTIGDLARQGLAEGGKLRWKFWERAAINDRAMDQALLGIEEQAEPRLGHALRFTRELARQSPNASRVYQRALEALTREVSSDLAPMAGFVLAVSRSSDAPFKVKTELESEVLASLDGGKLGQLPAPPDKVLELLQRAPTTPHDLARGLAPLLDEKTAGPAVELLAEKAPDWVALHGRLPMQGLEAARALVGTIGNGPAPAAAAWALQLCENGHDLAAWGLEQNRAPDSPWHRWNDEWNGRRPLEMLRGSLSGQEPTPAERTRLTREELGQGDPAPLLDWLCQTNPGPESALARDLLAVPLADESTRVALLRGALDGDPCLADQARTLRDQVRLLYGELATLDGPFQGVREELLEKPWEEQAVKLWSALSRMRTLESPTPVQQARCLAEAAPELDGVLWRNLAHGQPLLANWTEHAPADRREAWDRLEELSGSMGFQMATQENQALVRENERTVDIGPVRLQKRAASSRSGERAADPLPAAGSPPLTTASRFLEGALHPALAACPADARRGSVGSWLFDQAVTAGRRLEGGRSSKNRAMYTLAAAIAGDRSQAIGQEARAGEGGRSSPNRAMYAVAAAQAGSPEAAEEAFKLARVLEGGTSSENRAIWTQAAALAGSPERGQAVREMARQLEGGRNSRHRAVYAVACAIAGDSAPEALANARRHEGGSSAETRGVYFIGSAIAGPRSDQAYAEARAHEGGRSSRNRALYFVAAAVAGSPELSELAFKLARQAEGGRSSENRAYYAIAAAAALNPGNRHLAAAVFYPEVD